MRLQLLTLRIDGEELNFTFHWRLTLVTGLQAKDRADMLEVLFGSMAGNHRHFGCIYLVDGHGRAIRGRREPDNSLRYEFQDGVEAPSPLTLLGVDEARLRQMALVPPDELIPPAPPSPADEPPQLIQARQDLARLDASLAEAQAAQIRADRMGAEVGAIENQIKRVHAFHAHVRYVALLADLERVRAEAAALKGQVAERDTDDQLLMAAETVRTMVAGWGQSLEGVDQLRAKWGNGRRLKAEDLARYLTIPDEMPPSLMTLAQEVEVAEARCRALESNLTETAAQLPATSDPVIVRLARLDQAELWPRAQAVVEAKRQISEESTSLGGVETGVTEVGPVAARIEDAHARVDAAEALLDSRRIPGLSVATASLVLGAVAMVLLHVAPIAAGLGALVAVVAALSWTIILPRRAQRQALREEKAALAADGLGSWLQFCLRRVDALTDRGRRAVFEDAMRVERRATAQWLELAGEGIEPADALKLKAQVWAAVELFRASDGPQADLGEIERRLREEAAPALAQARAALSVACQPFGVEAGDHPTTEVGEAVQYQVEQARAARLQRSLMQAEKAEREAWGPLNAELTHLGFATDDPLAAIQAFESAVTSASGRQSARKHGRPVKEVEAELTVLEQRARQEGRPEWGHSGEPVPPDGLVDIEELQRELRKAEQAGSKAQRGVPDMADLQAKRDATAQLVSTLESKLPVVAGPADPEEIGNRILARVAAARQPSETAAKTDEPMPLILDNPFIETHGEDKWNLLDLIERVSEEVQIILLSDDPEVVVWGRRRAAAGAATLLESADQTA